MKHRVGRDAVLSGASYLMLGEGPVAGLSVSCV